MVQGKGSLSEILIFVEVLLAVYFYISIFQHYHQMSSASRNLGPEQPVYDALEPKNKNHECIDESEHRYREMGE